MCGRNAWAAARKELSALREMLKNAPPESLKSFFLYALYLEGAIQQGSGDTAAALSTFKSPDFALGEAVKPSATAVQKDLSILASLNIALIIHMSDHPQHHLLSNLVSSLEPLATHHQSCNIRTAFRFLHAVALNSQAEGAWFNRTKENVHTALNEAKTIGNSQLLCLALNFMAEKFFRGVVGEQALKSARTSVLFARKGRNDLWRSVADGILAESLETQGQEPEAAQVRQEAVDIAARFPAAMQRDTLTNSGFEVGTMPGTSYK